MRCQDVERLIPASRELSSEERAAVEAHLASCARCSSLHEFWPELQAGVRLAGAPQLPSDLAERVRRAGHAEILSRLAERPGPSRAEERATVPGFIWAAFAAITVLTLAFLLPGLEEFQQSERLTLGTGLGLLLLLQNALTLLFAPVVMRPRRRF
jgi:anti-sigma factor RsiW